MYVHDPIDSYVRIPSVAQFRRSAFYPFSSAAELPLPPRILEEGRDDPPKGRPSLVRA